MSKSTKLIILISVLGAFALVQGCAPAPRRTLNAEDKLSDMYWFFSKYNENYAPLEYKEQRFGFKYEELKAKYLAEAQATKTNEEFYKVAYRFVSEFRDAHNSASITNASLPARAKIGYLGFSGRRQGDALLVTEFLPTSKSEAFPVKEGDLITKLNGVSLPEIVKTEMVLYRNVGHDEANLTYHMNRIFNRVSTVNGLPTTDTAVLTIKRGEEEAQVSLPWIVKDLYVFKQEQEKASGKPKSSSEDDERAPTDLLAAFKMGYWGYNGKLEANPTIFEKITRYLPSFRWHNTFRFVDDSPTWILQLLEVDKEGEDGEQLSTRAKLAKVRDVPAEAEMIEDAKVFPAYTVLSKVMTTEGKETGAEKLITYMHVDTFSPSAPEEQVLTELKAVLKSMKNRRSGDLVIDMIDNGGGSLLLGLKMAQALSNTKVVMPEIQFRLSDSWLDNFETDSLMAETDTQRELNGRVYSKLLEDREKGLRLSRKFSVEALMSFPEGPNSELKEKLNIVLLVNEMCASMCDIFTAVLKDNKLATVVGSRTMGAGGNVVNHAAAPNSNMQVRQTESLILRGDGVTYIENNGVTPDIEMSVNESANAKYAAVRDKAFTMLSTLPAEKTETKEKPAETEKPVEKVKPAEQSKLAANE